MDICGSQLKHYATEIDLNVLQETFSNLQLANTFAIDIGGSLVKIVYQKTSKIKRKVPVCQEESYDYIECDAEHSSLCFIKFETRHITECLTYILENIVADSGLIKDKADKPHLKVTGGGAIKYNDFLSRKLNLVIDKEDEVESIIGGCVFLLKNIPDEVFYFENIDEHSIPNFSSICLMNPYPFLLVNIGSGISIVRVDSEHSFTRVGGTSIGGGTFWGIGSIIAPGKSFDELLMMASMGDSKSVDMLVKDIYGGPSEVLGLPADLIASSFGLAARDGEVFTKEDVINSLLVTISNNIGQLSCLHASICKLNRIIFGGFFTRGHIQTMKIISSSVAFWSNRKIHALFLRHEGYLGAIGAFLKSVGATSTVEMSQPIEVHNILDSNWTEDYAGSLSFSNLGKVDHHLEITESKVEQKQNMNYITKKVKHVGNLSKSLENLSASSKTLIGFETRELERMEYKLEVFKMLYSPAHYIPDSWDLTCDMEARTYWLKCFKENIPRETVYQSQREQSETAKSRSVKYLENYVKYLSSLEENPALHGILTVRCLLDAHQNFLRKYGFTDPFWLQKKKENEFAMRKFTTRMAHLKSLDWRSRQYEVIIGLLAGNVFDWGSKEVVSLMSKSKEGVIDFSDAIRKLQVDLIVIEGMARAIHTNLMADFICDSLKVAVIKNVWLANRLGGNLFSVVFKQQQYLIYQNFPPPIDIHPKYVFLPRKGRKSVDGFINQMFDPKIPRMSDTENLNLSCLPTKKVSDNGRLSPCLPPCLLESERMHFVQQWINELQEESYISDMTLESEAVQSSSSGTENNSLLTYNNNNSNTNQCSGLYDFIDRDHASTNNLAKPWQQCPALNTDIITVSSRFTNDEVQIIIKLFEDYFRRGICPSLGDVRSRITDTLMSKRRTAQAIRAKIKRLQSHHQVPGLSFIN